MLNCVQLQPISEHMLSQSNLTYSAGITISIPTHSYTCTIITTLHPPSSPDLVLFNRIEFHHHIAQLYIHQQTSHCSFLARLCPLWKSVGPDLAIRIFILSLWLRLDHSLEPYKIVVDGIQLTMTPNKDIDHILLDIKKASVFQTKVEWRLE